MKKLILLFGLLVSTNSFSQTFGFGVSLGAPSGFTGNYFLSADQSIDGFIGFDIADDVDLHADYLFHSKDVLSVEGNPLHMYYGGGFRYLDEKGEDDILFGVRAPIALYYMSPGGAFEGGLEFAGVYSFIEDSKFDLEGAIILRFYF